MTTRTQASDSALSRKQKTLVRKPHHEDVKK